MTASNEQRNTDVGISISARDSVRTMDGEIVIEHEKTDSPNWDTAITCLCGERCTNNMQFYIHRGDAYRAQIEELQAAATKYKTLQETQYNRRGTTSVSGMGIGRRHLK